MTVFSGHEDLQLPDALASQYEIRSCLKYSEQTATYLLREKKTDRLYLLKTASDPVLAELLVNENNILKHIRQGEENRITSTFPSPVSLAYYSFDGTRFSDEAASAQTSEAESVLFYIRTFIEGKTLEELCEMNYKKPGLPPERALDYLIALTELLDFLHSMEPPLIHRDIKPQNVIIDPEGTCHFIDLGISRFYCPEKRSDTFIMGTKLTAPPEQFGYHQTDMRSDLYSLGILLFYCMTGEYEITDTSLAELAPSLQQIIRKATMFDPEKRYQSAKELLADLVAARYADSVSSQKHPGTSRLLLAACMIFLFGTAVFASLFLFQYRKTQQISAQLEELLRPESAYVFTEPLIEEAVRLKLNNTNDPVTYADLEKITELHIFGLQIYSNESEVWLRGEYPWFFTAEYEESGLYTQMGTIQSLEDIQYMPNLHTLCLYRQQIEDISVLKDTTIRNLGLGYNPITDLTPLTGNENILYLSIPCVSVSTPSIFGTLTNLHSLNISNTGIRSLAGLENCPLDTLNLFQVYLFDYSELSSLFSLSDLTIDSVKPGQLASFRNLPLTRLEIHNSDGCAIEDFSIFPELESLLFNGTGNEYIEIGSPNLPKLTELEIGKAKIADFTELSAFSKLNQLSIYGANCSSYDGLEQIPNLQIISCTTAQYQEISAQYPKKDFVYIYSN